MSKILNKETIFSGHIFDVERRDIETDENSLIHREVVQILDNAVAMMVYKPDTKRVAVNFEYRAGIDQKIESIPAGKINPGEQAREAAIREIREELGIADNDIKTILEIATVNSSEGFTNERVTVFAVELQGEVVKEARPEFDKDEFMTHDWISLDDFKRNMLTGPHSAPAVVAALWAMNNLN